jgi:hypothetical protein
MSREMLTMTLGDCPKSLTMWLSVVNVRLRGLQKSLQPRAHLSLLYQVEQSTLKRRTISFTGVDEAKSFDGYVLFCPLTFSTARLIDNDGKGVHSWKPQGRIIRRCRLFPDGNLATNTLRPETEQAGSPYPFASFHNYGGSVMSEQDWHADSEDLVRFASTGAA